MRSCLSRAYIIQPLLVAASDGVVALVSWLVYVCSDTVERRMLPGGTNDERLTDVDTYVTVTTVSYRREGEQLSPV